MKASELLHFVIDQHLSLENGCDHVFIESDSELGNQKEFIETFFGIEPTKEIQDGEYLYIYSDCVSFDCGGYAKDFVSRADLVLESEDYKIYLFRIED